MARCADCGWMQQLAVPATASAGTEGYRLVKPARSALNPWADPTAYFALLLAALGAAILKQPVAAFIGGIILLAAVMMLAFGLALAVEVQKRQCALGGAKDCPASAGLNALCLIALFCLVLLTVSPLFGGGGKVSVPVEFPRVIACFILSVFCSVGLVSFASKDTSISVSRWWLMASYWLCYVPAAAYMAAKFNGMGWRGGN
ncbi:MAG: hypothetical protein ABMA26_09625 [Limisphaerales bacterium]